MVRCPDADFVLVIARALPSFMLTLVDTGIFYSVRAAVSGVRLFFCLLQLSLASCVVCLVSIVVGARGFWVNARVHISTFPFG